MTSTIVLKLTSMNLCCIWTLGAFAHLEENILVANWIVNICGTDGGGIINGRSVYYVRVNDSGGNLENVVSSHSETSSCDAIM